MAANEENKVVEVLKEHRSIRKFTSVGVPESLIENVLLSAQRAPSSHHVQAYSIIRVEDEAKRKELEKLCGGQSYVKEAPVFLVFLADFWKHSYVSQEAETTFQLDETENVILGAVDAALAAENAYIAAQALGLGGVMIGGIRNNPHEVRELLQLPAYTFPVMGMCLGYAEETPEQKPRLPLRAVIHKDRYEAEKFKKLLPSYDAIVSEYYQTRSVNKKKENWSEQMSAYFSKARRINFKPFLHSQGFPMK